ncbi:MAG: hypothetical protein V2A70_00630 [Candidatus Omnitrophota bacterium]
MSSFPLRAKIFLAAASVFAVVNIWQATAKLVDIYPRKKPVAFNFAGSKFEGMGKLFPNEKYVGYYTDQNINDLRPMMELLQAQQVLAPIILDPENLNYRYIIVNALNIPAAIEKFKNMGAKPVTRVILGLFIVENKAYIP